MYLDKYFCKSRVPAPADVPPAMFTYNYPHIFRTAYDRQNACVHCEIAEERAP